jgi:sulfotransferase famil protein
MIESVDRSRSPAGETANGEKGPDTEPGDTADPGLPFAQHVLQRTVVLPELRVLFVPVPKAGCTTVLWLLAELAGIPTETFAQSPLPEVSPALTVHDMRFWDNHRLDDYEGDERERMLVEEGWLRFATVRHPATRLWSAWQSKVLLREPRFVESFGDEPWFPRIPKEPADIVEDFRRFVTALADGTVEDVHWAVQHDLVRQLPLSHVGRVERLDDTLALLRDHVSEDRWPVATPHQNRAPLPMPPGAYDDAAAAALHERYRADFDEFGYDRAPPADGVDADEWQRQVATLMPLLQEAIDKHARIGDLHKMARRVQPLEKKLETVSSRDTSRAKAPLLTNLERYTEFNVRWRWAEETLESGFTAVVRVKNEAQWLPWMLPPLFRAVRHVLLVDNGSSDGSVDVARRVAEEVDALDRLEIHDYPFQIARCGQEHLDTPSASVHSLAYFYNWSFSHVRTGYALKWDGDMVLTDDAVNVLRDLAWQLEASEAVVKIPRYPLYVADDRHAFLDIGMRNCEPWAWPNLPGYSFVKAMEWELPLWPSDFATVTLPAWSCLELKHLDADEFDHWSDTDFDATTRTRRKWREWEVFRALAEGGEPAEGVVAVEAPENRHVVDYVRSTWLPEKAAEWSDRRGHSALGQVIA